MVKTMALMIVLGSMSTVLGQSPQDPNKESRNRALFEAVKKFDEQGILKALEEGADINAQDPDDWRKFTALMKAFHDVSEGEEESSVKIADLLLSRGADVNRPSADGTTALLRAACDRDSKTVKKLLLRGANPNLGNYPIVQCAAQSGDRKMLALLLRNKANINAADGVGTTALMEAAQSGKKSMVKYLLSKKADVNLKNTNGETALMLSKHYPEVQEMLRTAGAQD